MTGRIAFIVKSGMSDYPNELAISATLPEEISDTHKGPYGDITLTVSSSMLTPENERDWECISDLNIEQAIVLRDSLTMLINYLKRNPKT